jgi:hypothetical protein
MRVGVGGDDETELLNWEGLWIGTLGELRRMRLMSEFETDRVTPTSPTVTG